MGVGPGGEVIEEREMEEMSNASCVKTEPPMQSFFLRNGKMELRPFTRIKIWTALRLILYKTGTFLCGVRKQVYQLYTGSDFPLFMCLQEPPDAIS